MQAELLRCEDPRWQAFLCAGPHDFYHLPAYVDLCARCEGGQPAAFWASDGEAAMLVPMVLRPLPPELDPDPGWRDSAAPYGYPCPLLRGAPGDAALTAMLSAFREVGAACGIVSAFLRMHPLLPLPEAPFQAFGDLVRHGETIFLDLGLSREELDRQTRVNHLADVRRLEREGFRMLLDPWDRLDDFIAIYEQTMAYRDADPFYRFGRDYFVELRRCLGERLHLSLIQAPDGAAAAAGLFTWVDGLVQFHLSGTSEDYRRAGPAKLMLIRMRDWAQEQGARFLHLGGGVGCRPDSLAFFKQGFSKLRAPFGTFRMVLQPDIYQTLLERSGDAPEGFFPRYRHPAHMESVSL